MSEEPLFEVGSAPIVSKQSLALVLIPKLEDLPLLVQFFKCSRIVGLLVEVKHHMGSALRFRSFDSQLYLMLSWGKAAFRWLSETLPENPDEHVTVGELEMFVDQCLRATGINSKGNVLRSKCLN